MDEEATDTLQWKRGGSFHHIYGADNFSFGPSVQDSRKGAMEKRALHVSIIGGGIGGLAAAVALQRPGIQVTVFERNPELCEIGAGLTLWASAGAGPAAPGPGRCPDGGQCSPHLLRVLVLAGKMAGEHATGYHRTAGRSPQPGHPSC